MYQNYLFIYTFVTHNIRPQMKYENNEWLIVINPNAGKGHGGKDWNIISSHLEKSNIRFISRFTEKKGDAINITKEAVSSGTRNIITVGGDGTLNEVVNGIFADGRTDARDFTIGLIPVGTGNDWGRMFGIPLDYQKAVSIIAANKTMLHDLGTMTFYNGDVKTHRLFINIAGMGFESVVVLKTNHQKDQGRGGKLIYFYNLLTSLLSYRNNPAEIIVDGVKHNANVFSINVGNGRYCGGGMRQTPNAIPFDGLLDVTVINGIGKFEIIRNLKILYDGSILSHPKIDGYRCRELSVNSSSLMFAEADGESLGHSPVSFGIIPSAINIIYGDLFIQ